MDNISRKERSRVMSLVKQKDTGPEMKVRSFLHRHGLRYLHNDKRFPGKPDLVFPRYKTVVFVHGCFWHGHTSVACKLARVPKTKVGFWKEKVKGNSDRDIRDVKALKTMGWKVLVIWECELSNEKLLERLLLKIREAFLKHDVVKSDSRTS